VADDAVDSVVRDAKAGVGVCMSRPAYGGG
jgi:hypothetical protein